MTSCKLFFIITILVIIIATTYIVHSQYRMFTATAHSQTNSKPEIDKILEDTLASANEADRVKITINKSPVYEIVLNELNKHGEEINTSPGSNKIQIKNIIITTNQCQQIIKENFVHTNYMEAVHIICTNGLLITCIVERTETTKSIEETYTHINRAINNQIDTKKGNVILILDGLLNIKRTLGQKFTLHSTNEQQVVEFPCSSQTAVTLHTLPDNDHTKDSEDDDEGDISIITDENLYGFNSKQNNSKFRQTLRDSGHKKYLNHVKNIIFP